jgi:hypothetical protein
MYKFLANPTHNNIQGRKSGGARVFSALAVGEHRDKLELPVTAASASNVFEGHV